MFVIGFDIPSSERAVSLAERDPRLFATVGVHPHDAPAWNRETEARLRAWADHPGVVAIGEIGLDHYRGAHGERTPAPPEVQRRAFSAQIALARDTGLPLVIHCRDAYDETVEILETETGPTTPVVLHCFAGERRHAERAWARGWLLGIGGAATFKNQDTLRDIVRAAPGESLLLETDAPYLSPAPLRGRYPNEPARVALVADKLAEIRGIDRDVLAALTTANAARAFPRWEPPP
jgi:TatD DNase family protein